MSRRRLISRVLSPCALIALTLLVTLASSSPPARAEASAVLVVVAHPDDETLGFGGAIESAIASGRPVYVAVVTNGALVSAANSVPVCGAADGAPAGYAAVALQRNQESEHAMAVLGGAALPWTQDVATSHLFFLGYPDGGLSGSFSDPSGLGHTYADQGDATRAQCNGDYHYLRTGVHASLNASSVSGDISALLDAVQPTDIYTHGVDEGHSDHATVGRLVIAAVRASSLAPTVHFSLIHQTGDGNCMAAAAVAWPNAGSTFAAPPVYATNGGYADSGTGYLMCPDASGPAGYDWGPLGPPTDTPSVPDVTKKASAIQQYASQLNDYMTRFGKSDEIFWTQQVSASGTPVPVDWPRLTGTGETVGSTISLRSSPTVAAMFAGTPTGYSYQWLGCDGASRWNCTALGSATSSPASHAIGAADVGQALRLEITAHSGAGDAPAVFSGTTNIVPPKNSVLPTISGVAQQNQTLTAATGTWLGNDLSFSYKWQRCNNTGGSCVVISGATSATYALVAADVGKTIRVAVTASAGGANATAVSAQTAVVLTSAPVNTALPAITGTATQGATLTASTGTWTNNPTSYTYQWERCDASGASCTDIASATLGTYVPVASDVGKTIRVAVTAHNSAGDSTPAVSAQTLAVVPLPPGNTILPAITGTARVAETLSVSTGTWTNNPTSFAYQWQRCDSAGAACAAIEGQTAATYRVVDADLGHTVRVLVSATNAGGSGSATTAASELVKPIATSPINTAMPTISGTAKQTQKLTAIPGSWLGASGSVTYQWRRCDAAGANCVALTATAATYTLVAADVGKTIRVAVSASNAIGKTTVVSDATAVVLTAGPINTALPTISGTAKQGQKLTATTGSWIQGPTSYAYQWQRCDAAGANCVALAATAATYTLVAADVGKTIRVAVTAANAYNKTKAVSAATVVVLTAAPVNAALPTIAGTAKQVEKLTAAPGAWTNVPTTYAYQWLRCGTTCANILYATKATYTLVAADVGKTIRVAVTAGNVFGKTKATSDATAVVLTAGPVNSTPPEISGTAKQAQKLTASKGDWSPTPTTYAYQWQRCDAAGANCVALAATTATYSLVAADIGKTIRVAVTAGNAYNKTKAVSDATPVVLTAAPVNTALPTISGSTVKGQKLTAAPGSWDNSPTTYTYQWQRCGTTCSAITGATSATYTLTSSDVGKTIRVVVTAVNAYGKPSARSDSTAVVTAV